MLLVPLAALAFAFPVGSDGLDVTARALATGDAQRAVSTGNDGIFVNPAGLAASRRYTFELDGVGDVHAGDYGFGASVVDSVSSAPVAAGAAYTRWELGLPTGERTEGNEVRIASAYPISQRILFGATGKYLGISGGGLDVHAWTFDAGFLITAGGFRIGVTGQNLIPTNSRWAPLTGGLGVAFGSDDSFQLSLDTVVNLADSAHPAYSGRFGLEYLLGDAFPFRAGVMFDQPTKALDLTLGLGLVTSAFGVDVGWRHGLRQDGGQYVGVSVKMFLE